MWCKLLLYHLNITLFRLVFSLGTFTNDQKGKMYRRSELSKRFNFHLLSQPDDKRILKIKFHPKSNMYFSSNTILTCRHRNYTRMTNRKTRIMRICLTINGIHLKWWLESVQYLKRNTQTSSSVYIISYISYLNPGQRTNINWWMVLTRIGWGKCSICYWVFTV